jgi:IclR family acetate operon transcriptional repressor
VLQSQHFVSLVKQVIEVDSDRRRSSKNKLLWKAFAVLRAFRGPGEWLTSLELSQRAKLPKASGHRLVQTLEELGAIARGPNGRYRLGMMFVSLYHNVAVSELLHAVAAPILQRFSSSMEFTLHMGILENGMVTYICKVAGKAGFPSHTRVNMQHEAYCSALGKILLGGLSTDEFESFLHDGDFVALTPNTITDRSVLRAEVERARLLGYATDREESSLGLCCVAVPIFAAQGQIIAAISACGSPSQITDQKQDYVRAVLRTVAQEIGRKFDPLAEFESNSQKRRTRYQAGTAARKCV